MLVLGTAIGGAILFAFITAWVFGREFSDHTAKELLALPTPREVIVGAKFVLIALLDRWDSPSGSSLLGLGIGKVVGIPGGSPELGWTSFWYLLLTVLLTFMLMPWVALFASIGTRLPASAGLGHSDAGAGPDLGCAGLGRLVPVGCSRLWSAKWHGPNAEPVAIHSYVLVLLTFIAGVAATLAWWRSADQAR